ncbi:MAG: tRNA preQ1(34) S-adenosylmethionine ribosyltransferase-isomerase QueA [Aminobacterium sp.]|jgi:S-adenosylmethionine:tRNA ribosyltransferase-isomerase|uniref:tRNA preQ1(34) S-adenosylmethionine ribosyltransferase-isomerase QueA n=1 Tax=unclassified Aminobacterium TaxID=2685012 RepID=UPI001BCB26FB|nr:MULTISPECIES: tRNA preQ1(34) S-adenosylmethionine ribosyltransferase-isomerase QueA [unclassified Aminobacterium]MDD2207016.1 tRNA preQ1(34) S-adenosylmethionine ribosyltransferase-isomerase QueA [Aminobacterium sp.]MDD3425651.1 tRNA preQ1(34) S-adenosylmethionine ribosyltransferase-isomerase QueA [Aminobacterium sp.]MDD3707986.1 tRNA preQ1(34) S-adenosylmethionine ribosyltransferase-isomerase QueA [Aminobacterium sp.]MDD4228951.1 tRNA preQ1(34) S-adenosylmethionine ribosyltransferase-isomer
MAPNLYDIESYAYDLPEERIAQNPVSPRNHSKLLVLDKETGKMTHSHFYELNKFLKEGDVIILNDTRVIPARLHGIKEKGSAHVEILLLKPLDKNWKRWEALLRPGRRLKPGSTVFVNDTTVVSIQDILRDGIRIVEFPANCDVLSLLEHVGEVPFPPYIKETNATASDYQTVFAKRNGSCAAPTASLHFTEEQLRELSKDYGISFAWVTLHVGLGTFRPVQVEDIRKHIIHEEYCEIPKETADFIRKAKREGRRILASGTTVARTLESMATHDESVIHEGKKNTSLFIYPGYNFSVIDGLITNFHLPRSTLLMLVAALAGYDNVMEAYKTAVKMNYRFFSFGDAMLIQ